MLLCSLQRIQADWQGNSQKQAVWVTASSWQLTLYSRRQASAAAAVGFSLFAQRTFCEKFLCKNA